MAKTLHPYRLPNGRTVLIDMDAARGAASIDFTLADGSVVVATQDILAPGVRVDVLNAIRLPNVEQVIHTGTIERVTLSSSCEKLYWISGRSMAVSARVLRCAVSA